MCHSYESINNIKNKVIDFAFAIGRNWLSRNNAYR